MTEIKEENIKLHINLPFCLYRGYLNQYLGKSLKIIYKIIHIGSAVEFSLVASLSEHLNSVDRTLV